MKTIIHKADARGQADYGWLKTKYSFSFANYYNPDKLNFGALRVLNDDWVEGGQGFGRHPHDNMEIVTLVLDGDLEHKDSMGNTFLIRKNEVQVMSAGTGIFHSEYNKDPKNPLKLFQIWVFPNKKNVTPRYDQKLFLPENRVNKWQRLVSPNEANTMWLHQDTYFSIASLDKNQELEYKLHTNGNGIYIFLIEGLINVGDIQLERRDAIGIYETEEVKIKSSGNSEILLIEVPMSF
jgi:redox-sensitive bicupin YhaK (pirin superfamily)